MGLFLAGAAAIVHDRRVLTVRATLNDTSNYVNIRREQPAGQSQNFQTGCQRTLSIPFRSPRRADISLIIVIITPGEPSVDSPRVRGK